MSRGAAQFGPFHGNGEDIPGGNEFGDLFGCRKELLEFGLGLAADRPERGAKVGDRVHRHDV
jgi:hypothetical protein